MADDAVDEVCCVNCGYYADGDCAGCSGKAGICCCNLECCCKSSAPCLFPLGCIGCKPEMDGCSLLNAQCQVCVCVSSAAIPCNKEVPLAVSIAGLTLFPVQGCCIRQKEIMDRD